MNMIHTLTDVFACSPSRLCRSPGGNDDRFRDGHRGRRAAILQDATGGRRNPGHGGPRRRRKAVNAILGPGAEQIISSGDAVQDENTRKVFLAAYDAKHSVQTSGDKPATLLIGPDDYPFAIPIAKKGDVVDVRHRGRARGGSCPPHRPQRTRGDPGVPRLP